MVFLLIFRFFFISLFVFFRILLSTFHNLWLTVQSRNCCRFCIFFIILCCRFFFWQFCYWLLCFFLFFIFICRGFNISRRWFGRWFYLCFFICGNYLCNTSSLYSFIQTFFYWIIDIFFALFPSCSNSGCLCDSLELLYLFILVLILIFFIRFLFFLLRFRSWWG